MWESAAACMRNYLILREKVRAFRADPEVKAALAAARVGELAEPTLAAGETWRGRRGVHPGHRGAGRPRHGVRAAGPARPGAPLRRARLGCSRSTGVGRKYSGPLHTGRAHPVSPWEHGMRKIVVLAAVMLLSVSLTAAGSARHTALATTTITVNGSGGDRVYDGVGAILGGGRQRPLPRGLPGGAAGADHGLPVRARLRGVPPAAEAGDRRGRELLAPGPSRASSTSQGDINCGAGWEFDDRQAGRRAQPEPAAVRAAVGGPGLGRARNGQRSSPAPTSST